MLAICSAGSGCSLLLLLFTKKSEVEGGLLHQQQQQRRLFFICAKKRSITEHHHLFCMDGTDNVENFTIQIGNFTIPCKCHGFPKKKFGKPWHLHGKKFLLYVLEGYFYRNWKFRRFTMCVCVCCSCWFFFGNEWNFHWFGNVVKSMTLQPKSLNRVIFYIPEHKSAHNNWQSIEHCLPIRCRDMPVLLMSPCLYSSI